MDDTDNHFPDIEELERTLRKLRIKFPATIHTPQGYFNAYRRGACSSATVIIAPDGALYYPCHILNPKGPDLRTVDLDRWCATSEARDGRRLMKQCTRNCGWYQYYSVDSYTSIGSVWDTLRPVLRTRRK